MIVLWLMAGRSASDRAERRAQQLIAASFVLLAVYVVAQAVRDVIGDQHPAVSWPGIGLAAVTLLTMPPLAAGVLALVIAAATGRLRDLLSDLGELNGLDLTDAVRLAPVELAAFAQELEARFRPAAAAAGIKLSQTTRGTSGITDARLLQTIASNLVSTAIHHTPAGGHVEIALRQHRDGLVLAVRDSGVGIALEHQQRIFERLYRIDETRDRDRGSGLGLAIAHRAAQSLGGHIELESTPGHGSEFRLILPLPTISRDAGTHLTPI